MTEKMHLPASIDIEIVKIGQTVQNIEATLIET